MLYRLRLLFQKPIFEIIRPKLSTVWMLKTVTIRGVEPQVYCVDRGVEDE